jgi:lipopolysaccharide/colanic/teichoic acid biosynthesis glycosyltransferase/glycosyltransferase involved in cell wall biosynthesis
MTKRLFDILFSLVGLLISSPILFISVAAVWLQDSHSPFYIAPRVGRDGRIFRLVKLRTMVIDADRYGVNSTSVDDSRITRVGRFIRRFKLDELPQLWNVLLGEMSMVGPRPNIKSEIDLYTAEEKKLLSVKPGITDFSSIIFADEGAILAGSPDPDLKYNQVIRPWKSRLGLFYIDKQSVRLDVILAGLTVAAMFSRRFALSYVQKILIKLGADERLAAIAGRKEELRPYPPPGADSIVSKRSLAAKLSADSGLSPSFEKKRICIAAPVSAYHNIRVFYKQAKSLEKSGYSVVCFSRIDRPQTVANIQVKRVPAFKRRFFRFLYLPVLFIHLLSEKADCYHLHNPDTLLLGFGLKLFGKKVIYETHANFRFRILMKGWIPVWLRPATARIVSGLEKRAARKLDGIVVTQEEQLGTFGEKAVFLPNAPIVEGELIEQAKALSQDLEGDSCFRVIYIGGLSADRGLYKMIDAMTVLAKHIDARLWLIGAEPEEKDLACMENHPGWEYVDLLGYRPVAETWAHLLKADVGLAVLSNKGDFPFASANKLYEYQAFSLPFIASNFAKWKRQLEHEDAGIFIDPESGQELVSAILQLAGDKERAVRMGKNGRRFVEHQFNWERESEKLLKLYKDVLPS